MRAAAGSSERNKRHTQKRRPRLKPVDAKTIGSIHLLDPIPRVRLPAALARAGAFGPTRLGRPSRSP
jgi:hypothetical protein